MCSRWEALVQASENARKEVVLAELPDGYFRVRKLVDRKKNAQGRVHFLVHWEGYSKRHRSWEPRHWLMRDVPGLVREYERNM
jgi:hypothetical protein